MRRFSAAIVAMALVVAACGDDASTTEVRLLTHDSFAISQATLDAFTAETGVEVVIIPGGDAGQVLNQAIVTRGNPIGDVLYGVDSNFLSRALDSDLFLPHRARDLDRVPTALRLDPANRVTPIDFGDVCLNVDKAGLGDTPIPGSLDDLTLPAYEGLLVVEHPGTSSPGLAFLLATIDRFGESGTYTWRDFWAGLAANDVSVASGWEEAYYGVFSGGSGQGDRPIVVSYASSPPAEVLFSDPQPAEAPTAVVEDGCYRQIEFAGILRGTDVPGAAADLIDFMLSKRFQEDIPLNMFVFPAREDVPLPAVFIEHTTIPARPATLDPDTIEQNRERWIEEWTEIVLR